jgi:hypothetical protein
MQVEITKIAREDVVLTLWSLGFTGKIEDIYTKLVKNTLLVCFTHQGIRVSRFVSTALVKKCHVSRLIDRSKSVRFIRPGITETNHKVDSNHCDCMAFGAVRVDGKPVCKHTIAYAKRFMNVANFREMVA